MSELYILFNILAAKHVTKWYTIHPSGLQHGDLKEGHREVEVLPRRPTDPTTAGHRLALVEFFNDLSWRKGSENDVKTLS